MVCHLISRGRYFGVICWKRTTNPWGTILSQDIDPQENNGVFLRGKELRVHPEKKQRTERTYRIHTDLSQYQVDEESQDLDTKLFERIRHNYGLGALRMTYYNNLRRKPQQLIRTVNKKNFIPFFLVDLFSSVAAQSPYGADGVLFSMADANILRDYHQSLYLDCRVQPKGQIPRAIRKSMPEGNSVRVIWGNGRHRQNIYYDSDHQIVWQQDLIGSSASTMQAVSRTELVKRYPQADQELDDWLRIQEDENTMEVL